MAITSAAPSASVVAAAGVAADVAGAAADVAGAAQVILPGVTAQTAAAGPATGEDG